MTGKHGLTQGASFDVYALPIARFIDQLPDLSRLPKLLGTLFTGDRQCFLIWVVEKTFTRKQRIRL